MAQMAIYVDAKTAQEVKKASRKEGLSRSKWVSRVIKKEIAGGLSSRFFEVLGSWEDERSPGQILKDIRQQIPKKERPRFR